MAVVRLTDHWWMLISLKYPSNASARQKTNRDQVLSRKIIFCNTDNYIDNNNDDDNSTHTHIHTYINIYIYVCIWGIGFGNEPPKGVGGNPCA